MTIYRQIALLIVGLLAAVFIGTMATTVRNTQIYLQEQLHSHAQDSATMLGILLSRPMASGEKPEVVATIQAVFDSGYYRRITVGDMQGEIIVDRVSDLTLEGVPSWLVKIVRLETPVAEAAIMSEWNQAGVIRVTSHPGYAYRQIWNSLWMNAAWFAVGAILIVVVGLYVLRVTFRPLSDVERQAEAIARREFPLVAKVPRTRELASIVKAMNTLAETVERMLNEADAAISHLHSVAFQSPVTGLPNRQRFMDILAERIGSDEECSAALLCLVELRGLEDINNLKGYPEGDRLLKEAGRLLQSSLPSEPDTVVAHLSGATFAVLTEDFQDPELFGNKLASTLCRLREIGIADSDDVAHVGITVYDGTQNTSQLLSDADRALRSAQSSGANAWAFQSGAPDASLTRTATEWREVIRSALDSDRLRLAFQPAVAIPDRVELHREALVRIAQSGEHGVEVLLNASEFMAMAASLGLTKEIDRHVIKYLVAQLEGAGAERETIAMNLSSESIRDPAFASWVAEILDQHPQAAHRICFEIPEYGLANLGDEVRRFVDVLLSREVRFGLDNVGARNGIFSYLRSIRPDYIKIDGSFIRGLNHNHDHKFFVSTIVSVAHGLDIRVIAKSVEDEAVWNALHALNVDGAQGYYIARPEANYPR